VSDLSVVICSLNGAEGVARCLDALARQSIADRVEVVVVDDGSTDDTAAVAQARGAVTIRHPVNRGLSAARNTGLHAASAPVVGFLDDDCEPEPDWAQRLLGVYADGVLGVGGAVESYGPPSWLARYLHRRNPLAPLELGLEQGNGIAYRFGLYLKGLWDVSEPSGLREVFSLVGANMSYRRAALVEVGGFDERFTFGAEELDLCLRLRRAFPDERLMVEPDARIRHYFDPGLRDTLRRSRAYGRGSARLYRKWPHVTPTFFPAPVLAAALLALALVRPSRGTFGLAALFPLAMFPAGLRRALAARSPDPVPDAYLQLLQEVAEDVGFVQGLWLFRDFLAEPAD
jgi:glycosyltransferase involved in cell wall biosynthesis